MTDEKVFQQSKAIIPHFYEKERFMSAQAMLFIAAELFILLHDDIFSSPSSVTLILIFFAKTSIVFFAASILASMFSTFRLNTVSVKLLALDIEGSDAIYDELASHAAFLQKIRYRSELYWVFGFVLAIPVSVYFLFVI